MHHSVRSRNQYENSQEDYVFLNKDIFLLKSNIILISSLRQTSRYLNVAFLFKTLYRRIYFFRILLILAFKQSILREYKQIFVVVSQSLKFNLV